mmetsp:Transcript_117974/g.334582  ORF Transcript_117974/g.334582 Transcript_117974/m.334582 type:complete len:394 (+) Transcript_117974:67-1248(+)
MTGFLFLGALISAALVGRSHASQIVYVGSTWCDFPDCHPATEPSNPNVTSVWEFHLSSAGHLTPGRRFPVPGSGLPAWLLAAAPRGRRCLFATLNDRNKVASFEITASGLLPRGEVPSEGTAPIYATLANGGRTLLVANYFDAVLSLQVGEDCALSYVDDGHHKRNLSGAGSRCVASRQDAAHPHSFVAARGGLAFVCDLGRDVIYTYSVGPGGELTERHRTQAKLCDGPRHLVQHPTRPFVYVVNELASTVTAYAQDGFALKELMSHSTLPSDSGSHHSHGFAQKAAEIAISPSGRMVYVSNRGVRNTICAFEVLDNGHLLQTQQHVVDDYPRGMTLAKGGSLLLVAGQRRGQVETLQVGHNGALSSTGVNVVGPPTASAVTVLEEDATVHV